MIAEVARVLAVLAHFAKGQDDKGNPITLVESNGNNDTWINRLYARLTGYAWAIGAAWCAMTVSDVGYLAGVLPVKDFSAGAWALTDHLQALGGFIADPELAAVVSYAEGEGHTGVIVSHVGGSTWIVGEGNWGDRFQLVTRDLNNVPGGIHGYARFPGVQQALNPHIVTRGTHPLPGGTLAQGDSGQRVADLQLWLNRKRLAKFVVDGQFGPATKTVMLHVQHGIQQHEDGQLTPALHDTLIKRFGA